LTPSERGKRLWRGQQPALEILGPFHGGERGKVKGASRVYGRKRRQHHGERIGEFYRKEL